MSEGSLPKELLSGVRWAFRGGPYATQQAFEAALVEYHQKFSKHPLDPKALVLPVTELRVGYMRPIDGAMDDDFFEIAADSPEGFTAGELLFKIHNAIVVPLKGCDHVFFEGLSLRSAKPGKLPLYGLSQGS